MRHHVRACLLGSLLRQMRTVRRARHPYISICRFPRCILGTLGTGCLRYSQAGFGAPSRHHQRLKTLAQLEAILAPTPRHVRRRDNLTGGGLCGRWKRSSGFSVSVVDSKGIRAGGEGARLRRTRGTRCKGPLRPTPRDSYVCKFYLDGGIVSPELPGGDPNSVFERIMAQTAACRLRWTRKTLLAAAGMIAVAGPLMVGLVGTPRSRAQSQSQQQPALAFEVASVKPNKSIGQGMSASTAPLAATSRWSTGPWERSSSLLTTLGLSPAFRWALVARYGTLRCYCESSCRNQDIPP